MRDEITKFVERCQKVIDEYMSEHFPSQTKTLSVSFGRKYAKIIATTNSRSVWAFVDMTTGDILKPASWKAPAKHARGNINDESGGMACIGPYGPAYLK